MTLKFDLWPRKIIGHLFYTTSSFVYHLKSIGQFKLKLHSGNAQVGSKSVIFVICDLEIWWMTMENNRAPLLCYIKLCASFQIHRWIETEVTVRKPSIWVKICDFLSLVTLKFDGWPWKTIGHLFYTTSSFVHHLCIMWIQTWVTVRLSWVMTSVTLTFDLDLLHGPYLVLGDNSWKFHDDTMMGT